MAIACLDRLPTTLIAGYKNTPAIRPGRVSSLAARLRVLVFAHIAAAASEFVALRVHRALII